MPDMNDLELVTSVNDMIADAVINQDSFIVANEELLRRYKGELYGTEVAGRSKAVSNDVQDTVDSDMVSLVRLFLGSNEIFKFKPNGQSEKEVAEAEEKTKYVDWLIRKQPTSFATLYGFLLDTEIQKMGVLKYFYEETEKTEEHEFKNVSGEEFLEIEESLSTGDGEFEVEVLSASQENERGEVDFKFRVTVKRQEIKIIGIPTESFLLSQNSSSLDDANLVGDTVTKSRGQLLAEGHTRGVVEKLTQVSNTGSTNNSNMQQIRFNDEGGGLTDEQFRIWANQEVEINDTYPMIDYDGDGIAERRHIQTSGDTVLVNEAFDHVPYAMASSLLMAHKAIGRSRAEKVAPVAVIKTALTRQMLDNGYMHANPKMGVNENANLDDWLNDSIGGVVRTKGKLNPSNDIFPILTPFIGDKTLLLLQHMDQVKAKSVGDQLSSQGLNADQLNKETATRFNGVEQAAEGKIELVGRVINETGFRKLYEGVAWMVSKFQTTEREFSVLGKALTSNPSKWRFNHHVESEVGLGAGDSEKIVESMTGIWNIQQVLKQQGSPLVDADKEYNTLSKLSKAVEIKDVSKHFNDPKEPDELLKAENERLNKMVLQQQGQLQAMQNPLAEAEEIKQRAFLQKATSDAQLAVANLAEEQRQFNITAAQDAKQFEESLIEKFTELELKYNKDVPGSVV
jgi:hypothetical protein